MLCTHVRSSSDVASAARSLARNAARSAANSEMRLAPSRPEAKKGHAVFRVMVGWEVVFVVVTVGGISAPPNMVGLGRATWRAPPQVRLRVWPIRCLSRAPGGVWWSCLRVVVVAGGERIEHCCGLLPFSECHCLWRSFGRRTAPTDELGRFSAPTCPPSHAPPPSLHLR